MSVSDGERQEQLWPGQLAALLAPAGVRDLLYVMPEEQVDCERIAVRGCGLPDKCFVGAVCVCVQWGRTKGWGGC